MIERPFQHIVRIRSTDDLQYVNPDVMDEVTINANQLENDIESAAVTLPVSCQKHQTSNAGPAPEIVAPIAPRSLAWASSSIERG